jgi:hypothetical protein
MGAAALRALGKPPRSWPMIDGHMAQRTLGNSTVQLLPLERVGPLNSERSGLKFLFCLMLAVDLRQVT